MRLMRPAPGHRPDRHQRRRGQSLVEFAIVLPILLFLTVIALDFGRVYLGWINLQSMSRIAANLASNNPTAWQGGGDADVQAKYQNQIRSDATATNCRLPTVGGVATAPDPTFSDTGGNGTADDIGDSARVELTCTFGLITPGIRDIFGGSIAVSSSAVFPVKSGMTASGGGPTGSPPNAAFTGDSTISPSSMSCVAPCTIVFRDTSGGVPTSWEWDFNDGSPIVTVQDPLDHTFVLPGTYVVTLTARNALGQSTASMGITVTAASVVDFTSDKQGGNAPLTVQFTESATPGGTAYAWTFGTGEGTGTGASVSHTYSTPGTYAVSLTVTYPILGDVTTTKTNYISVDVGLCTVPSLNGVRRNDAQSVWNTAGFTGTVSDGPRAPNGNYTILYQSITASSQVPCSSSVTVNIA